MRGILVTASAVDLSKADKSVVIGEKASGRRCLGANGQDGMVARSSNEEGAVNLCETSVALCVTIILTGREAIR
jgi:hypothetical protein